MAPAIVFALAACDPVHDDRMAALGDEAPNVGPGPFHRPGQPCTTCHDGKLGSPREFSVAGTIFKNETGSEPAEGATVTLTTADGASFKKLTNSAGNFYFEPHEVTPRYPMKTEVSYGTITVKMDSLIGRAGACADCHTEPARATSPGHIFIPATEGGIP